MLVFAPTFIALAALLQSSLSSSSSSEFHPKREPTQEDTLVGNHPSRINNHMLRDFQKHRRHHLKVRADGEGDILLRERAPKAYDDGSWYEAYTWIGTQASQNTWDGEDTMPYTGVYESTPSTTTLWSTPAQSTNLEGSSTATWWNPSATSYWGGSLTAVQSSYYAPSSTASVGTGGGVSMSGEASFYAVTPTSGGTPIKAKVVDSCAQCGTGIRAIDLSPAAFAVGPFSPFVRKSRVG
ncbi:hypothetical protein T439DRAFT_333943 [Meredithblackwellia eburnea MCA 4105]